MIKNIKLSLLTLAFGLVVALPLTASAALTVIDVTVNGATSTTITPVGTPVTINATTVIDGTSNWKGSRYLFAQATPSQASMICANTSDVAAVSTSTLSGPGATTPGAAGVYNLYVSAQEEDNCLGGFSDIFELPGALTVLATPQTITFDTIASTTKTYGDTAVTVYATSSSLLPVTFSTTATSTCTVSPAGLVTFTGVGSCDVTANQAGDMTYAAATPITQTFTVNPALVTLDTSGAIATKVYDATTTVAFSGTPITVNGAVNGDILTVTGSYSTKNVGTSTVTLSLVGAAAANYTIAGSNTIDGTITARSLAITATGTDKVYDATTAATVTYADDSVVTDDVTVSGTATFTDKHVGIAKNVDVVGISLTGADAGNYTYSTTASTTANITAKALALNAVTDSRVYNGTASSTGTVSVTLEGSDTYTAYQEFDNKTVGVIKTITPYITILDGNGGNNYAIATTTATGAIIAKELTLANISIVSKVYDKTDVATMSTSTTPTLSVIEAGDDVTADFSGATFTYDNVNASTGKTVAATGIVLTGADAGNYTLATTTTTGDITPRPLSVTPTTLATKVYDTTTTSSETPVISSGTLAGADTASFTQAYADKDAATGKTIDASGLVLDGNAGANYDVTFVSRTDGVITPATLNVTALGGNKVYDGNVNASSTLFDNRISTSTDTFVISFASSVFGDKHVGNGKIITITGLAKTGLGADNYAFATTTITTTADITARTLTATAHVPNKVYDTTTNTTVSYTDDRVTGDAIGLTGTAAFSDKTAGLAKLVLLSPVAFFGPDATNYTLSASSSTTADISPASASVSFTVDNKIYDATSTATILTSSVAGAIGSDDVTVSGGTANFTDKNVANGKTATATGFVLGGVDGNNYMIATVATTTGDITALALVPTVLAFDKVYDATTTASTSLSVTGLAGDDVAVASTTGNFDDKNVNTNKTVIVNGMTLVGTDAGNYSLTTTSGTDSAAITSLSVTATITAADKVYDATSTASVACSVNGQTGDDITCTVASATFTDETVATGKTVTATGIVLGGADAGNYNLTSTEATTTASITPVPVVPAGSSQSFGGGGGVSSGGSTNSSTPVLTTGAPISSIATSTLTCASVFTKYMRYGRANDKAEVIKLQAFLNKYMGAKLPLTGFFGTMTRSSVMKFQATYLKMKTPTGLVLLNTITMMNTMSCAVENN